MTEILEPDPCEGIEPDHWERSRRMLRDGPQAWLDELKSDFFARGGQVVELEAATAPPVRRFDYYAPDVQPQATKRYEAFRSLPTDGPWVERISALLERQWPSRRAICQELGISDGMAQRILTVHFKNDPRAEPYQRAPGVQVGRGKGSGRRETAELWEERKLLVQSILEQGVTGYRLVAKASGLDINILYKLVEKFDLPIRKFKRESV